VTDELIPKEVQAFLDQYIDSVPQLELLLLLRGQREKRWTLSEIVGRLYTTGDFTRELLSALIARHLVESEADAYRYGPATPELAERVDRTATTYSRELVALSKYIHGRPVPSDHLTAFADAFRLKKETKDGDR
jgi:hypothetical protein